MAEPTARDIERAFALVSQMTQAPRKAPVIAQALADERERAERDWQEERDRLWLKIRDADAVMRAIDEAVVNGRLATRTPITDARENYGPPFTYPSKAIRAGGD